MRHSTVSTPIESCNASSLNSPTLRFCALHLLHGQVLYFVVEPKSKTKELYNQACAHLASQGMLETDLFGLAVILDGEYLFVDTDYKLSKYAPKNWRSSSTHGLDSSGKPLLAFHFRVQFYVESPLLLRDETSRHQYYLQLRHNVADRNLAYAYVAEDIIFLLAGLALQADFGDYIESQHKENYFSLREYFPEQMVAHGNETRLYQSASVVHKANRALSKAQAETQFIREASSRDSFPLAHNSHLYRLKHKKHDSNPGTLWLAICTKGIELYEERSSKPINGTFQWNSIGKLCFDRKKFEIRSLDPSRERMIYYTSSDEKSKHLLTLCRLTHQFCMAIQTRLNELTRKEEEEKKQYRDWGTELNVKLTEMCYDHNADQRISVISTTSSNTTSGIVSDRVQSLDESEDDLDMEIMINSPPAASIESLALAHLRDSFSKEIRRINKKIPHSSSPTYQGETSESFCLSKFTLPATPAPTDGSQCSSSCSTVVVTNYTHENTKPQLQQTSVVVSNASHSTTSSLELGYSHTAQNSVLSDSASCCLELDYSVQSAHTSSGIYTLQSSCETNTVATTAVAGSSETSGLGQSVIEDSEGIRSRSGSIVSAPGSFHGDGSDPSDTGHGTPLTAEELSDLIVGRSPKPCRGKYPSVATVSETLDSVADYVTLPPPPIPPPCRMSFKMMEPSISRSNNHSSIMSSKSSEFSSYVARYGSISSDSRNSNQKYFSEEAMLQRQIQFQHLAAGFSPHLFMDTLSSQLMPAKSHVCSSNDISKLNECANESIYSCGYPLRKSKEQQKNHKSCISLPFHSEEAAARIISTKPQINMLKAQSSYVPSSSIVPSYATSAKALNCNSQYFRSQQITNMHPKLADVSLRSEHCTNSVPIVGSNNYLDVRRSGAAFLQQIHEKYPPPPPLLYNRQPPPPPPPPRNHYSVCGNVLSHQFDQYRQQLYSDVDYVIYPIKDPAISKQEYLDSKEASGHCSQYLSQTSLNSKLLRPYNILPSSVSSLSDRKSHAMYQSTPNVAIAGGCVPTTGYQYPHTRYASNQNLTSELSGCSNSSLVYLSSKYPSSTSPLYSTTASVYSSSMQSLQQDSTIYGRILPSSSNGSFTRTRSDDNILNCSDERNESNLNRKFRKPPPPPPPPYTPQKNVGCLSERMKSLDYRGSSNPSVFEICNQTTVKTSDIFESSNKNISLDICSLREKSKNLDLPLISALCNDKSLLKQTNTVDACKEQSDSQYESSWYKNSDKITEKLNQPICGSLLYPATVGATQSQSNNCIKSPTSHKDLLKSVKPNLNSSVNGKPSRVKVNGKKIDFSAGDTSKYTTNEAQNKSYASVRKLSLNTEVPSIASTKLKSGNTKLTKSPSSTNKLSYSISQPIHKTVTKVKSTNGSDNKSNLISKVKCRSSKMKSADLSSQCSRSTDINIS